MTRKERIARDAAAQVRMFMDALPGDDRELRDAKFVLNRRMIEQKIAVAKRFPDEPHLAEFCPEKSNTSHICVGAVGLALCGIRVPVTSRYRRAKTLDQILMKTKVNCVRCLAAIGL